MWRFISNSTQGLAHVADGTPCQDCSRVRALGEGADQALVACVADGAGSAKHSHFGATIACESVILGASSYFDEKQSFRELGRDDVISWCEDARARIEDDARLRGTGTRDCATTLCGAVVSAASSCFFQIGDGAIVLRKNGICGVAFWPQSGEYANTTNFITANDYRDHLQFYTTTDGFADVALLTDGIERLALRFDCQVPHQQFFDPLFGALRAENGSRNLEEDLREFLQSERVRSRSDDDKTLILASRVAEAACGAD